MSRDVILIPGLGKMPHSLLFIWLVPLWRLFGVNLHVCDLRWEDGQPWEPKYQKLKQLAQGLDKPVGIVAYSAGASAAVCLLAERPLVVGRVVTVCGLLHVSYLNPQIMNRRSPAFLTAMTKADGHLQHNQGLTSKLMTIRPKRDRVVSPEVATIAGAKDVRVATIGHGLSIVYSLVFKIGLIKRFLKQIDD